MTGTEQVAESSPNQCPECGGPVTTTDREAICEECGLVVGEHTIDHGPDWRDFPDDDGSTGQHAEPLGPIRHDKGLGTNQTDGLTTTEAARKIASEGAINSRRLYIRREIYRIGAALGWDWSHKERGSDLVRQLYDETGSVGQDADTIAAAICWLVGRVFGMGLSPDNVATPARDVDCDAMLRHAKSVRRDLGLPVPVPDYETRVRRVGDALDLEHATIEAAARRVRDLDGTKKSGASPSSLAAAALYIESDRPQCEIADAADVSLPSLRNRFDRFGFAGGEYHG